MLFVNPKIIENFIDTSQLSAEALLVKAKNLACENFPKDIFLIDFNKMIKLARKAKYSDEKKYRIAKKTKIKYNEKGKSLKNLTNTTNINQDTTDCIKFDNTTSFVKKNTHQTFGYSKKSSENKPGFCIKTKNQLVAQNFTLSNKMVQ